MKRIAVVIACLFTLSYIFPRGSYADAFETEYGLHRTVVIVRGGDTASFTKAMEIAQRSGAKGLLGLSPTMIFGRFPSGVNEADFDGLDVKLVFDAGAIDPMEVDLVTLKAARGLLDQEKIIAASRTIPMEPFDDIVFETPVEIVRESASKYRGPMRGAPAETADRAMDQNTEFMIGNILINLVLPESAGSFQSENWTDDEIGLAIRDVLLGLSQYENATNWVPMSFTLNCPSSHRRVPVTLEPIEGDWNYDPIWIAEAMKYLGSINGVGISPDAGALEATHAYNTAMRSRYLDSDGKLVYDWVFTAFVVDASENGCWQGPSGGYAAYTIFLGGPYMVAPYPACRFGDGINFAHVFIHEMSHIFWALDEYAAAEVQCGERSGYLDYVNANSYFQGCGVGEDCIMNNYLLSEPLPICRWTMGQVGLADDNNPPNSIPDLYEVYPVVEAFTPRSDTTYYGDILVSITIDQTPVPNRNQRIDEYRRIDYAPEIAKFEMAINDGFFDPVPGKWTGASSFRRGIILQEGLDPGENIVRFYAENIVGLGDTASVSVFFVGIRYYSASAMADVGNIEVRWQTAQEVFGADFEVHREDLTARTPVEVVAVLDGDSPYDEVGGRKRFRYVDTDVMPGHRYRYRVVGSIETVVDGEAQTLVYRSGEMLETAVVPLAGGFVSQTIPNPTDERGATFSIDVPRSYYDPSGATNSRDMMRAPAAEVKTDVLVSVYDVSGRKVREVYNLPVYGGQILTLTWDGLDDGGSPVAAGVYFMKVVAGQKQQVRKVVIIR